MCLSVSILNRALAIERPLLGFRAYPRAVFRLSGLYPPKRSPFPASLPRRRKSCFNLQSSGTCVKRRSGADLRVFLRGLRTLRGTSLLRGGRGSRRLPRVRGRGAAVVHDAEHETGAHGALEGHGPGREERPRAGGGGPTRGGILRQAAPARSRGAALG